MTTPKQPVKPFQPHPAWGIMSQRQHDEAIDWIFEELLQEPPGPRHDHRDEEGNSD
jgi:hypothetical protein